MGKQPQTLNNPNSWPTDCLPREFRQLQAFVNHTCNTSKSSPPSRSSPLEAKQRCNPQTQEANHVSSFSLYSA